MGAVVAKRSTRAAFAFIGAFLMLVTVVLVGAANAYAESPIAVAETSLSVDVDNTVTVYLSGSSVSASSWESSNTQAAVIESSTGRKAVVKGVGKGTADITATDENGNTATCSVTVLTPRFSIESSLKAVVEETANIHVQEGSAASWRSSDEEIARIESSSSYGAIIRGESVGTVVITATDKYGTESACTVRVRFEEFELSVEEVAFYDYWQQVQNEGWWDDTNYEYHYPHTSYSSLDYEELYASRGTIAKCVSGNNKVVSVVKEGGCFYIYPKGVGKTTVTALNSHGEAETVKCRVDLSYFIDKECYGVRSKYNEYYDNYDDYLEQEKAYTYKNLKYGEGKLRGTTYSKAKVAATIDGKTYAGTADDGGYYVIKTPKLLKLNTPVKITTSQYGISQTFTRKVVSNKPKITLSLVNSSRKRVTVTVKDVHKGDRVKLKVGKKTYTKKVKKDRKKATYKIKTRKVKKGQKVTATIYNQYNQVLSAKTKKLK